MSQKQTLDSGTSPISDEVERELHQQFRNFTQIDDLV